MSVRVRMAPSPTGFLHIGGVRTFLFNWLFARGRGGACLLRIENTDTSREVAESVAQIERSLRWLGIDWDEETTFQLDRLERAQEEAARLVAEGTAYEDEGAIRIRMPDEGSTGWDDAIKGRIEFPNEQLEDLVLVRSDGRPTYNFASPLDDWLDEITHVIRGDDHVSNTPKQLHVLRALGAEPPVYAHVPSVFGEDGRKLSKRHGAISVDEFRSAGYVPEALMNFLALLGWAPDGETTIMSRDELVERFSLERVGSSPATFDYAKLDWMNGVYLRELPPDEYARPPRRVPARAGERLARGAHPRGGAARAGEDRHPRRVRGLRGLPLSRGRARPDPARRAILAAAADALRETEPWSAEEIEASLKRLCAELDGKPRTVYPPIRVAVTGSKVSPGPVREPGAPGEGRGARATPERCSSWDRTDALTVLSDLVGIELGPTLVARGVAGANQRLRHGHRRSAVDPYRSRPGRGGPVRDDHRPRVPHAFPLRSDALRGPSSLERMVVNYGVNRVRFPAAVPSGGRVRGRFRVLSIEEGSVGERATIGASVECEGVEKPVCVAELVLLTVP